MQLTANHLQDHFRCLLAIQNFSDPPGLIHLGNESFQYQGKFLFQFNIHFAA